MTTNDGYPPPLKMTIFCFLFVWGGGGAVVNFFSERGFIFELGNFYSGERHFGANWVWGPPGWPIALIRAALLGHEF